jgi:hypothetical protein
MVLFNFVCVYVCLYRIQIHISELISTELCTRLPLRLEEIVGYVWTHNIGPFSTFKTSSVRTQCRILGTRWLPAQESLRQRYIRDAADDTCEKIHLRQRYIRDVADDTFAFVLEVSCIVVIHRQRREVNGMHVCKYGNLMRRRKWIMNCNCNCIAIIQIITWNLSNRLSSFFRTLSRDNAFFNLLNLFRRSSLILR